MQSPGLANGPEKRTDWNAVNWRQAQRIVRNLRQRLFRATQAGRLKTCEVSGLLEPCAVKVARTVLRGRGRSDAPPLPGNLGSTRNDPASKTTTNLHATRSEPAVNPQ